MNKPSNYYRDMTIGLCFFTGVLGFMSGEFILSTALFGAASLISNMNFERERVKI